MRRQNPIPPVVGVLAHDDMGYEIIKFLHEKYPGHLKYVVLLEKNPIYDFLKSAGFSGRIMFYDNDNNLAQILTGGGLDFLFLAWWPNIVGNTIIQAPKTGVINLHPSLLPYQRGRHYSFWNLVEDTPFGVSIHFVKEEVDAGDIIFQSVIEKSWEDTGESLFHRAKGEILYLFKGAYEKIVRGEYTLIKQNLSEGTFHYGDEIQDISRIDLEKEYTGRDLLNLLRAKMSPAPYGPCTFVDDGVTYEVRVQISRKDNG